MDFLKLAVLFIVIIAMAAAGALGTIAMLTGLIVLLTGEWEGFLLLCVAFGLRVMYHVCEDMLEYHEQKKKRRFT